MYDVNTHIGFKFVEVRARCKTRRDQEMEANGVDLKTGCSFWGIGKGLVSRGLAKRKGSGTRELPVLKG